PARRRRRHRPPRLQLAVPRAPAANAPLSLSDYFDGHGVSLVAGRAAFVPSGGDPRLAIEYAAEAGARAVVVRGTELPAGGLGLDESVSIPVISVPQRVARPVLQPLGAHPIAFVAIGAAGTAPNASAAAAGELSAEPDSLAFGQAQGDGWHATQWLVLRNVSARKFSVRIKSVGQGGLEISPFPAHVRLKHGGQTTVRLVARLRGEPPV